MVGARRVAVLLAGGRGVRLAAGIPKALATVGSRTLLERSLERLAGLAGEIRVVAPAGMPLALGHGAIRIDDPPGETGPLGALVAGLLSAPYEGVALVLAVDLPGATREALLALAERRGDAEAVIVSVDGIPQPLAGWYSLVAAARLAEHWGHGERSITRAALAAGAVVVPAGSLGGDAAQWVHVNTPDDLARANEVLA